MKLLTGHLPEREIKQIPMRVLSDVAWDRIRQRYGERLRGSRMEYYITLPAEDYQYAPTLGKVHQWLYGDWGPFYLSWVDGELCPFAPRVGGMNITCSTGRRKRCGGLLIEKRHINHLSTAMQRHCLGRVICYDWCHVLSRVYWDIPIEELLQLPDNPSSVAETILRRVFQESGWFAWRMERRRRRGGKSHRDWLRPIKGREGRI